MCMMHQIPQGEKPSGIMPGIPGTAKAHAMDDLGEVFHETAPQPRKIWEIDPVFRCPVVGFCLDLEEQKQILKKTGQSFKDKEPYDIHEIFVAGTESDNRLSRRMDLLLKRKFGRRAAGLHDLSEQEFMRFWKAAYESGDYHAEFWVAVTRRDLSETSRRSIFGSLHMAMHTQGEELARLKKQRAALDERIKTQDLKMKELLVSRRALVKENETLKRMGEDMKSSFRSTENELNRLRCGQGDITICRRISDFEKENERLTLVVSEKEDALKARDMKLALFSERIEDLTRELDLRKQTECRFRKQAEETMAHFSAMNRCEEDCPSFDLCRKRVLIVGGIERMEALYRQIIEGSGGIFEYHAGHMKGGGKHLESCLKRSDIVLCPVNCNSHAACILVKNLGKKHNKPVHMLPSFSLSTVSQVIKTCVAGEAA